MLRLLPLFAAFCAGTALTADTSGARAGRILGHYAASARVVRELERRRIPGNPSDGELRAVLRLLESRIGPDALVLRIRSSAYSVATLRLAPTRAFLSLVDLLLLAEDTNRVLARNVTQLRERNLYGFLSSRVVRDPFYCLPSAFSNLETKSAVLAALESAVMAEGYPLPPGRAEAIAVQIVPELAEALEKVRRYRPPAPCSRDVAGAAQGDETDAAG